ncbi:hypothetical protein STEG23_033976 [Scotinomys teguina]
MSVVCKRAGLDRSPHVLYVSSSHLGFRHTVPSLRGYGQRQSGESRISVKSYRSGSPLGSEGEKHIHTDRQEIGVLALSDATFVLCSGSAAGPGGGKAPAFQRTRVPATVAEALAPTCKGFSSGGVMMFIVSIIEVTPGIRKVLSHVLGETGKCCHRQATYWLGKINFTIIVKWMDGRFFSRVYGTAVVLILVAEYDSFCNVKGPLFSVCTSFPFCVFEQKICKSKKFPEVNDGFGRLSNFVDFSVLL